MSIQGRTSNQGDVKQSSGDIPSLVFRIAAAMKGELSAGDVAALRRLRPGLPDGPAFWKVAVLFLEPAGALPLGGPQRDEAERRWGTILQAIAKLRGLHAPGRRLGQVLAESNLAEMRFLRLLRARGDRLDEELRAVTHYLASKAIAVDIANVALLVLSDGRTDEELVRRRLARDFYSHLNHP